MNAQDAARYVGVPYSTLRDMGLRGVIPVVKFPGVRRLFFKVADLDRLIDSSTERVSR